MIGKIKSYITNLLVEGSFIQEKERELYEYCIEGLIETVGNLILTLLIGVILGKLPDTLVFLAIFIPLRSTCGGYHVEEENLCFLLSILLFLAVVLSAGYLGERLGLSWSARHFLISLLLIFLFAPVSCANKKLEQEKRGRLKVWIQGELFVISLLYFLMFILDKRQISFVISNAMILVSILLIIQYLKNMRENSNRLGA